MDKGKTDQEEIMRLQERIAWLEHSLEETNRLLYDTAERLDRAERHIKYLAGLQGDQDAVRPLSEETPPPHY